jgi:uncharacterized membrane protein YeaQ/YmgE (transglycosylase-associated protein family)
MEWSITNLLIQLVMGIVGGHAAAIAAKEHSFGALGHTVVGAIGGALSGYFLQTLAATVVTGTGSVNAPRFAEQVVLQVLTGAVAGAIAMLVVGFIKHSVDHHNSTKPPG